jgi:amino acid adenylation domain-containing protein
VVTTDPATDLCLHQLFEAAADRTPESIALIDGAREITYIELERRANQLARHLRRLGVGPEKLVGICAQRSADMIAGMLGTLKAGAAYLSLDPSYPRERLAFMLEDAASPVVLTQEPLLDRTAGSGATAVCFDRDARVLAAESPERLPSIVTPGSLAYAIYTSGSTGRPKGVAIEHRSAVVLCHWARATFPSEDLAAMLASTSINFDLSVFEIFVPLAWGGTVILAENALALPRLPAAERVRFVNTVPSAIAELVRARGLPPSVRTVGLAGEPLKGALVERIYAAGPVQGVYNLYGPSEDTTYSTWVRVERGAPGEPTIGRPITDTELYLLDSAGEPVPRGEAGEVYLSGAGLARGYLGRPDLTAERFLPDPFSGRPGARLYRVGDLGRSLPNGEVQFLGRVDHQVKIRGFRIELGEIEAALSRHPALNEAVVAALLAPGDDGDRRLVAYVEPHPGMKVAASGLRGWLRERLPAHFVPSVFVLLDALPRTPNGKVDRKALPEPDWRAAGSADDESAAARTPMEELVAGLWSEALGVARVGLHDHFLELGGHSLLAARLVSRMRDTLEVEIDLPTLFAHPTVAGLAAAVEEARGGATAQLPPLAPVPRTGAPRASLVQTRQWFLDQLQPGSPVNNIAIAAQLHGPLRPALLEHGLREIIRRHETLRTTFAEQGGVVVQTIAPELSFALPVFDLSALPAGLRETEVERLSTERGAVPFDLRRGPLLRAELLRLGREEHRLVLVMHHIVSDDWSVWVLFRELGAFYRADLAGAPNPLPAPPRVQYADYAAWQNAWMEAPGALDGFLAYAGALLKDVSASIHLPADRPRRPIQSFRGRLHHFALPAALATRLRELARREGATLFMALLAAFEIQIGRSTGRDRFLLGSPTHGRNRSEIEELIGFFTNTAIWRAELDGDPDSVRPGYQGLLRRVRDGVLAGSRFDALPFERIPAALRLADDAAYNPLLQLLFALQTVPRPDAEMAPGLRLRTWELDTGTAKVDLSLFLWENGGLTGAFEYSTDLFDESTIVRMTGHLRQVLEEVLAAPDRPVAEIELVPPFERWQVENAGVRSLPAAAAPRPGNARTPLEDLIAGVWEAVLGVERIGLHQSFFALGGHSLLATQILLRLRDLLQVDIPFRTLFEHHTVARFARAVRDIRQSSPLPDLAPVPRDAPPPLSFDQLRLWFLERLDPGTAVFNIPTLYVLRGPLRMPALRQALAEIVRRHEALRTTFAGPEEAPYQVIHAPFEPELPVMDVPADQAESAAAAEVRRPMDPLRRPLVRFLLLRLAEDEHRLVAVFHHLIADGGSLTIFEHELAALYEAFAEGRPSPLPELPVQYADYAAWQRRCLTGDHLAPQMAFWRERLAGPLPVLRLPTDRPRPAVPSSRGTLLQAVFPAELAAGVRELSRRESATLYVTLLAAFVALLHRATGERDLLLGTPVSHRDRSETAGLIGMFVNTLVLRTAAAPDAGFRTLLAHVRERALEAFAHQDIPFERLVDALRPERGTHDTPFFQLMFSLETETEEARRAGELEIRPAGLTNGTAQFELTLYMADLGKELVAMIEYRTELFEPATIERMLAAYQALLAAVVADPDMALSALPLAGWPPAPPSLPAPPPPTPAGVLTEEADAAREAELAAKRSSLSEAQRDLLRQRLQRRTK